MARIFSPAAGERKINDHRRLGAMPLTWNQKPFSAIGYGGLGGARAIEHLRLIGDELQMVSTRGGIHIGGRDFMTVHPMGGNKPIEEIEANLLPSAKAALISELYQNPRQNGPQDLLCFKDSERVPNSSQCQAHKIKLSARRDF